VTAESFNTGRGPTGAVGLADGRSIPRVAD